MSYFNETGPIYQQEFVQANEFSKFVHVHIVTSKSPDGGPDPENDAVRFDWEAFRAALSSSKVPGLSFEHEVCAFVPPYSVDTPQSPPVSTSILEHGTDADTNRTTVQAVIDTLVARFASLFTHALFISPSDASSPVTGYGADESPRTRAQCQAYFFDVLRRNLYCAFTRHLGARDAHEHCLSPQSRDDPSASACSAWEYRLLFVHSEALSRTVKGLVMTVTLEGNFEDETKRVQSSGYDDVDEDESEDEDSDQEDDDEVWCGVSLDSKGPFSGTLRAIQVAIGEGFQCP